MNKKLTIFSITLIIVGIIGTISTGILSVPYFINTLNNIEETLNKENIIFNKNIDIDNINISGINNNITIKKYMGNDIKVSVRGIYKKNQYDINEDLKTLAINEKEIENNFNKVKNLKELISKYIESKFMEDSELIVYIPNNVNINVDTLAGNLKIEDDVFLNEVNFKTDSGYIYLPKEIKNLDKLNIKSNDFIQLSMQELIGIKYVDIKSSSITIYSDLKNELINTKDDLIPNNLNITSNYVDITTDIPLANNLNVIAYESVTSLDIPINKYNFNFVIESDVVDLDNLKGKYNLDDDFDINKINELSKKNLDSSEKEYKVNIKSKIISF